MVSKTLTVRQQNEILRKKIEQLEAERLSVDNVDAEIKKFIQQSEKNVNDMTEKVTQENALMNKKLHDLTAKYEATLKTQITLLTKNKELSQRKQNQDDLFNEKVQKMTADYESKIKEFEQKVKGNVKKIKEISQANVIKKLLKSEKFKTEMKAKGVKIEVLEKQCQLEEIIAQVEQKETEIADQQAKSEGLDEQLSKMRELIQTMKQLMQNMVKQKQNIVKQNTILKEKLKQSQELIGKLLGGAGEAGEQNQDYDQDFEPQEEGQEEEAANANEQGEKQSK